MKNQVTIVPSDTLIIVDGLPLRFAFEAPENIHAVQWREGSGYIEWKGHTTTNTLLTGAHDYSQHIAPFVTLWEQEKVRLAAEAEAAEVARLMEYNSVEARAERLRTERDGRLEDCSWIVERHRDQVANAVPTTLDDAHYQMWLDYRQNLRDFPAQKGFPWMGGGTDDPSCPWPVEPSL